MSINKKWLGIILIFVLMICFNQQVIYATDSTIQDAQKIPATENALELSINILSNSVYYRDGWYTSWGGTYEYNQNGICSNVLYIVDDVEYHIYTNDSRITVSISEYSDSGKWIKYNSALKNGDSFIKQTNTKYIAIALKCSQWGVDIAELLQKGLQIDISKEVHKAESIPQSSMDNVSSYAFVSTMNVGWNLGNSLDSKATLASRGNDANLQQELKWGNPYVSKKLIDYVAACGFNTIRIPVTWYYNTYTDAEGNLHIGTAWLARVKEVVDYAITNDMYVILNSHHDQPIFYAGVSDEEMQQVLTDASNLWRDIAEYFKDYDEHLIFEAFNEIDNVERSWNYSDVSATQMNQMNQIFVDTVRATGGNNATRILIVPTLLDSTKSEILNAFQLPTDSADDRLVVQVHMYTKKFHRDIDDDFSELEKFSDRVGAPIIVGEFGTKTSYTAPELRSIHASNFVARAASHGIKCIWWDNGSNYGIIDRKNYANSNMQLIGAIMDGSKGLAYIVQNEQRLQASEQYEFKMPNLNTGAVEEKYWGTLTTNVIVITEGKYCALSLKAINEASDIWLQRVLFYDAAGTYLCGKELQTGDFICEIPEGASYVRVSANSPYRAITHAQYQQYLSAGDLEISCCFVSVNNMIPEQVVVK